MPEDAQTHAARAAAVAGPDERLVADLERGAVRG